MQDTDKGIGNGPVSEDPPVHIQKFNDLLVRAARHQIYRYAYRVTLRQMIRSLTAQLENGRPG
ncbi:hypothetical protein D3C73_1568440 [compost metagenome]